MTCDLLKDTTNGDWNDSRVSDLLATKCPRRKSVPDAFVILLQICKTLHFVLFRVVYSQSNSLSDVTMYFLMHTQDHNFFGGILPLR